MSAPAFSAPLGAILEEVAGDPAAAEGELARARARIDGSTASGEVLRHRFERAGDSGGPWHGVPYLTKANIAVAGEALDCCSAILEGYRSPFDATATARLAARGATCLGSTNMDEFAMGSSGETSVQGAVEHPFLPGRVCGGSSSGSAAAVARGWVPFALGSDTGGSVRQPAAWCGLVGLKPTWGRVSRWGLVAHASSLDTIGVLAARADDAARVLACIEGPDGLDSTVDPGLGGVEMRAPEKIALVEPGPAAGAAVREDLERLARELDATTVELPGLELALPAYVVLAAAEAASNLARYDGSLYGSRHEAEVYATSVRRTRSAGFGTEVKLRILLGTEVLRRGHTQKVLHRARQAVRLLSARVDELFAGYDALLLPTVPGPPFALGAHTADPLAMRTADAFTVLANLLGLPAVSVPTGVDDSGAPLSAQCLATRGADGVALGLAGVVEDLRGSAKLQDEVWRPRVRGAGR